MPGDRTHGRRSSFPQVSVTLGGRQAEEQAQNQTRNATRLTSQAYARQVQVEPKITCANRHLGDVLAINWFSPSRVNIMLGALVDVLKKDRVAKEGRFRRIPVQLDLYHPPGKLDFRRQRESIGVIQHARENSIAQN